MQPIKLLEQWLRKNAGAGRYLFTPNDLRGLFPGLSHSAFKALLTRAVGAGLLERVCRGIYLYEPGWVNDGLLLYHTCALLRADKFNYLSLESVLSDAGVISQIPLSYITVMSSGRRNVIQCSHYGTIEFVHTRQKPASLVDELYYDQNCGLWRASVQQAIRDMKATHRNYDLIDWDVANELI